MSRYLPRGFESCSLNTPDAWVELAGGELAMGSSSGEPEEAPVHRVTVSPFRIARYPVTNSDYAIYLAATGARSPEHLPGGEVAAGIGAHPVVHASWTEAVAFCAWLAAEMSCENQGVRLPTEAQWEFAARGSEGRQYPWGDEEPTRARVNYRRWVGGTCPVDGYPQGATRDGVEGLAGNAWEWCGDWFGPYSTDWRRDPSGPEEGSERVLRGGSWDLEKASMRATYRRRAHPGFRNYNVGFRVAAPATGC